jgi:hypothetical protein
MNALKRFFHHFMHMYHLISPKIEIVPDREYFETVMEAIWNPQRPHTWWKQRKLPIL